MVKKSNKMAELSTEYIEAIKKLIFKARDIEDKKERHEYIQRSLVQFFRLLEFNVFPEYTVGCIRFDHTSDHNRDSEFTAYYGAIDLYIKAPSKIHIAVEFDNGTTLRYSSIRKLLQCEANICIGLVYGSTSKKKRLHFTNAQLITKTTTKFKELIEETMYFYDVTRDREKHRFLKTKVFYFGVINREIFVNITPVIMNFIKNNKRDSFYYSI